MKLSWRDDHPEQRGVFRLNQELHKAKKEELEAEEGLLRFRIFPINSQSIDQ